MAGRGPAPGTNPRRKPPEQRRRRNKEPEAEKLAPDIAKVPALPKTYRAKVMTEDGPVVRNVAFLKETRDWYADWTQSSIAPKLSRVHWRRLQMVVAPLVDQHNRNPTKELAAEIRLQEGDFGGSPYALKRLGAEIGDPQKEKGPDEKPLAPVRRLRAVDPAGASGA